MGSDFVPLDTLFYSKVIKRNTRPDGSVVDPRLMERMQNPICLNCKALYQEKYPDQPFAINCSGIYDEVDYTQMKTQYEEERPGETIPLDSIREIYDVVHWAEKNIVVRDDNQDLEPFKARWYQNEILRCTAQRKVDRCGRGLGKALAINTPIPTPIGWVLMEHLEPGDQVFDEKGQICNVTFVTDVMQGHVCYDVEFSDGSVITADAEHLWLTWSKAARKSARRIKTGKRRSAQTSPSVVTTEEIRSTLFAGKEHNHAVPVTEPLQYHSQDYPIDPYVLGAWLGDGLSAGNRLACNDPEILVQIEAAGYTVTKNQADFMYGIGVLGHKRDATTGRLVANGSLYNQLASLNMLDNKHVPSSYLGGSVEQRLSLLQGLMDTDGNCRVDGWAEFDNTNPKLAQAVFELAAGLGQKPVWSEREATLNGKDCGISYRIGFFPTLPIFRLTRKLSRIKQVTRPTVSFRYIVGVRERSSVPVKCIQVDSPNQLYLAGAACIPTHNTTMGVIEELHKAMTNKNYEILVVSPGDSQSEKWFNEINFQFDNSPTLANALQRKKQQPFKIFYFYNGATISLFTAGSKSGRGADSVRSQSPRRIRMEEQDLLVAKDYDAILPLTRRYRNSEVHGSSTPTGLRGTYWQMCVQSPDYREFFFPITVHPDWNTEQMNEQTCLREAQTMSRYQHEYLAEFGDPAAGLFKAIFIEQAKKHNFAETEQPYIYHTLFRIAGRHYFMGIDWNGDGTGTRIRVVEYDPASKKRRIVDKRTVDQPGSTMLKSMEVIREMNRKWLCDDIFIDYGFGNAQDEMIRAMGALGGHPADARLKSVTTIDFGATLEFNKLSTGRATSKYINAEENKFERKTKPFMVDGLVMALEAGLFEFSAMALEDPILEEQMRAYRVKSYSSHGYAGTFEAPGVGDHDLDAVMLAMLACEMKFGLFQTESVIHHLAQVLHVDGWGAQPLPSSSTSSSLFTDPRQARREAAGIPSRGIPQGEKDKWRLQYMMRGGAYVAPVSSNPTHGSNPPSRTAVFRNKPKNRGPF